MWVFSKINKRKSPVGERDLDHSRLSVLTQFHSCDAQNKNLVRANSFLEQSLSVDRDRPVSFEYL